MRLNEELLKNSESEKKHQRDLEHLQSRLEDQKLDTHNLIDKLKAFQIAIPSWALGTGGTRFGKFAGGGEPRNLEEKIADVGLLHALKRSSDAISLHIPWDVPEDAETIKALATSYDLKFDAVNSNTFQDQQEQKHSYKFGSLCHTDADTRKQAVDHNIEVIR